MKYRIKDIEVCIERDHKEMFVQTYDGQQFVICLHELEPSYYSDFGTYYRIETVLDYLNGVRDSYRVPNLVKFKIT